MRAPWRLPRRTIPDGLRHPGSGFERQKADKVEAARLALYKLESRNGRREIVFSPKKQPKAIRVELTPLNADKLYRLEVEESLEPGEYALSAEGSNQVFCFQVF